MARRAASICRLVIQQASIACNPYWPKATLAPWVAMPVRRPRCTFRCLIRLGRSIGVILTSGGRFGARAGALSRRAPARRLRVGRGLACLLGGHLLGDRRG